MSKPQNAAQQTNRLLYFLAEQGAATGTPFDTRDSLPAVMLTGSKGRKLVPVQVLDTAIRDGLIAEKEGQHALTGTGKARLKRIAAGGEFSAQHQSRKSATLVEDGESRQVLVNECESPLMRLRTKRAADGRMWIDDAQLHAGERLRRDFTLGQLMQKVTSSWDAAIGSAGKSSGAGGKADLTDSAIDARQRLDRAYDVLGPDLAGVVTDVCCFLKGLETVEKERRWPPRSAKLMLRTGLDLLARHYGTRAGYAAR